MNGPSLCGYGGLTFTTGMTAMQVAECFLHAISDSELDITTGTKVPTLQHTKKT